jgi:hypothetical protein
VTGKSETSKKRAADFRQLPPSFHNLHV